MQTDAYKTYTGFLTIDGFLNKRLDISLDAFRHLVLPVFTLSLAHWATLTRLTRTQVLEEIQREYITAAYARGLSEKAIFWKHAFRNAIGPIFTTSALSAAYLVTSVFIVEKIFNLKGVSDLVTKHGPMVPDAAAVLGFAVYSTIIVLGLMLVLDLLQVIFLPQNREKKFENGAIKQYAKKLLLKAQQAISNKHLGQAQRFARKALSLDASLRRSLVNFSCNQQTRCKPEVSSKSSQTQSEKQKSPKRVFVGTGEIKNSTKNLPTSINLFSEITEIDKEINSFDFKRKPRFSYIFSRWQSVVAIACILLIIIIASTAPFLAPVSENETSPWFKITCDRYHCIPEPPNKLSPLGTIKEFDVYHTLIWGTRQALLFGFSTALSACFIGILAGTIAAYKGGWLGQLVMRVCDAFLTFPIVAAVALIAQAAAQLSIYISNSSIINPLDVESEKLGVFNTLLLNTDPLIIAIILFSWMPYARIMYAQVIQVKNAEYIEAATITGDSHLRIIFKHILPNAISPAIILATRDVGRLVVLQSSLTFIGVGESSAWATLLNLGKDWIIGPGGNLLTRWWIYLPITFGLIFFGTSWSFLGDELNYWFKSKKLFRKII